MSKGDVDESFIQHSLFSCKMNLGKLKSEEDDMSAISLRSLSSTFSSLQSNSSDCPSEHTLFPTFDHPIHPWDSLHSHSLCTAPDMQSSRLKEHEQAVSQKVTPGSEPALLNYGYFSGPSVVKSSDSMSIHENENMDREEEPAMVKRQGQRRTSTHGADPWTVQFENLKAFKKKYGHCIVPQKYPSDRRLGIWVNKQRMEYNKREANIKSSMTDERVALLEGVGFVWAKRKGAAAWEARLIELKQYKAAHGDCNVNTKSSSLGRWASTQRQQYKLWLAGDAKSTLNEYRIEELKKLGFKWRL